MSDRPKFSPNTAVNFVASAGLMALALTGCRSETPTPTPTPVRTPTAAPTSTVAPRLENTPTPTRLLGVCDPKKEYNFTVVARQVPFLDRGLREGILDPTDVYFLIPAIGGTVKALDSARSSLLAEEAFSDRKPKIKGVNSSDNTAYAVLSWRGRCDGQVTRPTASSKMINLPSLNVTFIAQDTKNTTFSVPIAADTDAPDTVWFGRAFKNETQFLKTYNDHSNAVRNLTPNILNEVKQKAGQK